MAIDIIGWVKGWRLDKFLKQLFKGELNEQIKKYAAIAVVFLQQLKELAESPEAKEITDAIPGEWDAEVVEAIKVITPEVLDLTLQAEGLFDVLMDSSLTFQQKLQVFLSQANNNSETGKAKQLNGFAVSIAIELVKKLLNLPESSIINKILVAVPAIFIDLFGKK